MRKTEIEQAARAKVATFLPSKVIRKDFFNLQSQVLRIGPIFENSLQIEMQVFVIHFSTVV